MESSPAQTTTLVRTPGEPLGLKLAFNGSKIFISGIDAGRPASTTTLRVGDLLLEVNGHPTGPDMNATLNKMKDVNEFTFKYLRPITATTPASPSNNVLQHQQLSSPEVVAVKAAPLAPAPAADSRRGSTPTNEPLSPSAFGRRVLLTKDTNGFGMVVKLDPASGLVFIKDITPGGAAERTGALGVGDWILEIDERSMRGAAKTAMAEAMKGKSTLNLFVAPRSQYQPPALSNTVPQLAASASSVSILSADSSLTSRSLRGSRDSLTSSTSSVASEAGGFFTKQPSALPLIQSFPLSSSQPHLPLSTLVSGGAGAGLVAGHHEGNGFVHMPSHTPTNVSTTPSLPNTNVNANTSSSLLVISQPGTVVAPAAPVSLTHAQVQSQNQSSLTFRASTTAATPNAVVPSSHSPSAASTSSQSLSHSEPCGISPLPPASAADTEALATLIQRMRIATVRLSGPVAQGEQTMLHVGDTILGFSVNGTPTVSLSGPALAEALVRGTPIAAFVTRPA